MMKDLPQIDWYENRNELEQDQIFESVYGLIKLDRRVPGDGTQWYAATWNEYRKCWTYDDITIEPGDLIKRL